jgi:hypothetical protein
MSDRFVGELREIVRRYKVAARVIAPGGEFIFDDEDDDGSEVRYVSRAEIVRTRYAVT